MEGSCIGKPKNRYWRVFFLCLLVSAALFLPHCLIDAANGGFFHYAGDFNDQQIPFYSYANAFVKGGGSFSWATDLGSGFVNAYSFYLTGSPFFWLTLLIPAKLTPWFMVPMLCLKFALAGGGAYLWLRRWPKNDDMAVLGACLYAFSGFSIYNIFFNHFLDVVALFPYLLAALDAAVLDGQRGVFPVWVALNLLTNYFFFAGQAVFLILYFLCMCAGGRYRLKAPRFFRLAFETLLGCVVGCVFLIPAGLSLLQNPRTIDPFNGYGYLVYGDSQQYLAILSSLFLVPEAPYLTDAFSKGILKWTSLSAYLPLVGIAGGLAFCRLRPKSAFSRLMKICLLFAFVPVLNSAFYTLNSSYYARWYYMPILILCAATVLALEDAKADFRWAVGVTGFATAAFATFALVPNRDANQNLTLGVVDSQPRYWAILGMSLLGVVLFAVVLALFRGKKRFPAAMLAAVLAFSFLYGTLHLSLTKYGQWYHDAEYVQQTYREADALNAAMDETGFYRIDAYDCYNNMGLWLNKSCIQFFNSTVAPHILEFYPTVGVTRDVNSKPDVSLYALRGLLSVRYTLVPTASLTDWTAEHLAGWSVLTTSGSYTIFENENYLPMGFTYEYYITPEQLAQAPESERGNLLLKALVLSPEQIAAYGSLLAPLPESEFERCTYAAYTADCDARREQGVQSFTATNTGFTAELTQAAPNLVFFSVPYDDGFTATVNGAPATVENVDSGLMAVLAPAGESTITFTYRTPGLRLAGGFAAAGGGIYAVYLIAVFRDKKRKKKEDLIEYGRSRTTIGPGAEPGAEPGDRGN